MASKTHPRITRALAHYEAALAALQETLVTVDKATLEAINAEWLRRIDTPPMPGALTFQYAIHESGDAFRAAKQVLDPARALPSTAPKTEDDAA
jgi:hypothetical protein